MLVNDIIISLEEYPNDQLFFQTFVAQPINFLSVLTLILFVFIYSKIPKRKKIKHIKPSMVYGTKKSKFMILFMILSLTLFIISSIIVSIYIDIFKQPILWSTTFILKVLMLFSWSYMIYKFSNPYFELNDFSSEKSTTDPPEEEKEV